MLFEKISYEDDFPLQITIADIREYPIHYHQDIEFVYVLKGSVFLRNGYYTYELKEGELFTNCGHEVHQLYASCPEENIVALIQISTRFFSKYFPNLSKSCYRTYVTDSGSAQYDDLREMLLQILLRYCIRDFNYKTECTYRIIDVIKLLEKHFNLFIFDGDIVVGTEERNPVVTERLTRIIGYIYEHFREKITLEDLAEMEHLSTFYLSHIIRESTGMNFREFLCFARVEMSEIELLETDKKISRIARDIGFSTTSYYKKHFSRWFGHSPEEHRKMYLPKVRQDAGSGEINLLSNASVVPILRTTLSAFTSQTSADSVIRSQRLEFEVDADTPSLGFVDNKLNLQITCEDFQVLGHRLLGQVSNLHPSRISVLASSQDLHEQTERLVRLLTEGGFTAETLGQTETRFIRSSAFDTVAYPIVLMSNLTRAGVRWNTARLRDPGDPMTVLKGESSLLTAQGIRKPSYYAYRFLSLARGDIIECGKHHCVIRMSPAAGRPCSYLVLCRNINNDLYNACMRDTSAYQVRHMLTDFKDELFISLDLHLDPGVYSVIRYDFTPGKGVFNYLSAMDFPAGYVLPGGFGELFFTEPNMDFYIEDVRTLLNLNFTMRGAGLQLAMIHPKAEPPGDPTERGGTL